MVAVKLDDRQTCIHHLLVAELVTSDIDLSRGTSLLRQVTASRLGHHQILGAALSVNSVDGFVGVQIKSGCGRAVTDDLAVGGMSSGRQASARPSNSAGDWLESPLMNRDSQERRIARVLACT